MICSITSLLARKPLLVCNHVLLKIYFAVSQPSVIVTQLLNIAKKRDFKEAQNHSQLETSLFSCHMNVVPRGTMNTNGGTDN